MNYIQDPMEIERGSFRIIATEIVESGRAFPRPDVRFNALIESIITRAIHTSADFDYLDNLKIDIAFLERVQAVLDAGTPVTIYTDTNMALSGINKKALQQVGWRVHCYVADPEVAALAKEQQMTRSMAAVDKALSEPGAKLFVFGNAPTAIFRLLEKMTA
ncbi:MAG: precorrin-8X methylmutase, partial [Bacillota bacterium]|nr:precorrin-8X methylmutase [Bacillota bacterium]